MKLHKDQDVALLLIGELATNRLRIISLGDIASRHGLSVLFLKKIARQLKAAGILTSKEGNGGGYILAKKPSEITAWDVLVAVSDHARDVTLGSTLNRDCPLLALCLPQHIHREVHDSIKEGLVRLTYDKLVRELYDGRKYVSK